MRELVIALPEEGKKRRKANKTRVFRALHLAHFEANALWGGSAETIRPVWIMVGGSEAEIRPFVANLQLGKKFELRERYQSEQFELLRSARYQYLWQRIYDRTPEGFVDAKAIVTAYLPEFFQMDPGMVDTKGVGFCLLPTLEWIRASSATDPGPSVAHVREVYGLQIPLSDQELGSLLPVASLFCVYLDRRTRCPLIADPCFYLQIFCASLASGLAGWTREGWGQHDGLKAKEVGLSDVGLFPGVVCKTTHEALETFLAEQVRVYFEAKRRKAS